MHIVVVEALLICYLPRKRADTYRHKKTLSVERLSHAISWSLSSLTFPAGSCPAGSLLSWSMPAESLRITTETRPIRNRQSLFYFLATLEKTSRYGGYIKAFCVCLGIWERTRPHTALIGCRFSLLVQKSELLSYSRSHHLGISPCQQLSSSNLKEAQALKQGNLVAMTKENLTPMIMLIRLI